MNTKLKLIIHTYFSKCSASNNFAAHSARIPILLDDDLDSLAFFN